MPHYFSIGPKSRGLYPRSASHNTEYMMVRNANYGDTQFPYAGDHVRDSKATQRSYAPLNKCSIFVQDRGVTKAACRSSPIVGSEGRVASPQGLYKLSPSERYFRSQQIENYEIRRHLKKSDGLTPESENQRVERTSNKASQELILQTMCDEEWIEQIITDYAAKREIKYEQVILNDDERARYRQLQLLFDEEPPSAAKRPPNCLEMLKEYYNGK